MLKTGIAALSIRSRLFSLNDMCFLQAVMPQAELQEILRAHPAYSYVIDFNGDVVAALVSRPLKVWYAPLPLIHAIVYVLACKQARAG